MSSRDYILSKAEMFLAMGADTYRKGDFFNQPETTDPAVINLIKKGCEQLCNGMGFSQENPLQEIGISGFYRLMELFHFSSVIQGCTFVEINGKSGILDHITFEHIVEKHKVALYNFIENKEQEIHEFDEEEIDNVLRSLFDDNNTKE